MNEFIVFEHGEFYVDCSYEFLVLKQDGFICRESNNDYGGSSSEKTDLKPLLYIGKKDINNKKIYADSSIVEFANKNNDTRYYGYFKFDNYWQRMFIWFVQEVTDNRSFGYTGKGLDRVEYLPEIMGKFKIIDTIQENKLGLIK